MSTLQMSNEDINETFFSELQDILRDRHGDEILSSMNEDESNSPIAIEGIITSNSTVYTWIFAIVCSGLVGLSGLLPVIFTPEYAIRDEEIENTALTNNRSCHICDTKNKLHNSGSGTQSGNNNLDHSPKIHENTSERKHINGKLKLMLSFAVGGLLGDVFLHLLPEAHHKLYLKAASSEDPVTVMHNGHISIGIWIILGILTFILVEMIFNINKHNETSEGIETSTKSQVQEDCSSDISGDKSGESVMVKNNSVKFMQSNISVSGYLNLIANCVDNFSHGLAVGGAFLISLKVGVTTTICILVHEIPHEIGDFAILIKSGFTRHDAARAQMSTAGLGMCGAFFVLALDTFMNVDGGGDVEHYTSWIIPFTCGGFINISLVTVLPDILESDNTADCLRTLGGIGLGVFTMMGVSGL